MRFLQKIFRRSKYTKLSVGFLFIHVAFIIKAMTDRQVLHNFIALEGIDGAGTTTLLNKIAAACSRAGIRCFPTCEPTQMETGKLIRKVLSGALSVHPETLARMFVADRYEHVYGAGGVITHLNNGELVITDRYLFSSLAYQSVECGYDEVSALNLIFPLPEILVYIDIPVDVGDQRASGRKNREIFENREFQARVCRMYEKSLGEYSRFDIDILRIDGTKSEQQVFEKVWSRIEGLPIEKM